MPGRRRRIGVKEAFDVYFELNEPRCLLKVFGFKEFAIIWTIVSDGELLEGSE